jgi:hypothetical protein
MPALVTGCGASGTRVRRAPAPGFVLAEFLLALAIVSVLISIATTNYGTIRRYILSEDQASRLVQLAADVHTMWVNTKSYSTVSAQSLAQLQLVRKPMTFDGANLLDQWGNPMLVAGGSRTFAVTVGGAFNPMTPDECAAVVNRLGPIALNISVGQSATLATGVNTGKIAGGLPYKAGAQLNQDSLATGCSQPSPVVSAEFN